MANENKKYIPALRFPEFQNDDEWIEYQLGQIFSRITQRNSLDNQNVLTISAQYGLISQYDYFNKNVAAVDVSNYYYISKYDFAYNKSKSQGYPYGAIKPLKLYENGVVSPLYICFKIKDERSYINTFFEYYFESELMHKEIDKISQEGARNHGLLNISTKDFFDKIALHIPPYWEQQKIADCLSSLDRYIDATKRKLDLLKEHKKGLMQRLFPAKGKTLPELRFLEFQDDGEWKKCKLTDIAIRKGKKNTTGIELPVYTNSATSGVINQEEYFDREIITKDSLVNYGIIEPNDFVYNPRVSVTAPVGPISRNKLSIGVMSPLYLIFGFNSGDINFFEQYFRGNGWHSYLKEKANYGARFDRINIGTKEFMDMPVPYPSLAEQKEIADCLSSLDDTIKSYVDKISVLELHKKGLMQQLFPKL